MGRGGDLIAVRAPFQDVAVHLADQGAEAAKGGSNCVQLHLPKDTFYHNFGNDDRNQPSI
jgi:hypothetical protein